jgi:hypothetical protein
MKEGAMMVQIWGKNKQVEKKEVNTREVMQKKTMCKDLAATQMRKVCSTMHWDHYLLRIVIFQTVDMEKVKYAMELSTAKKRAAKAENKIVYNCLSLWMVWC